MAMAARKKTIDAVVQPSFEGFAAAAPAKALEKPVARPADGKPAPVYQFNGDWFVMLSKYVGLCSNPLCKAGVGTKPRRIMLDEVIYYSSSAKRTLCEACGDAGCDPRRLGFSAEAAFERDLRCKEIFKPRYLDMERYYAKNPGEREKWEGKD